MGGRQHEGTRSGEGWFGSEPTEPLVLRRGMAALPFPSPPLCSPTLPPMTHLSFPLPPPHPLPPALVLHAALAGLAPGCPSWPHREQHEPTKGGKWAPSDCSSSAGFIHLFSCLQTKLDCLCFPHIHPAAIRSRKRGHTQI